MDMPFAYLLSCSDTALGSFSVATLQRISDLKKAKRELEDALRELEATSQLIEWLSMNRAEHARLLRMNGLQEPLQLEGNAAGEALSLARPHRRHPADAA